MKYTKPSYVNEVVSSEDIMEFSSENIKTTTVDFDYGDGKGVQTVTKGTSTANIQDLLF